MERRLWLWAIFGGLLHSLAVGGNPRLVFSGEVQSADTVLADLVAPGDVLSGVLIWKPLTPVDLLADDPAIGKYEAFLHQAEITLDRHYIWRASYRFDGSRLDSACCRRGDLEQGQPQSITIAIPVDGQTVGKNWQAVWLEFWLYDRRYQMLPDDTFPRREIAWEAGTFRLTYLNLETGGFSYYSGSLTQFSYDSTEEADSQAVIAQLEAMVLELNQIIEQQQQQLAQLQKQIEESSSRERLLQEQLRQAQEARQDSAILEEKDRLSSDLEEQKQSNAAMREQIMALQWSQAEAAVREKEWMDRNNALQKALLSAQQESERWQSLVSDTRSDLLRLQALLDQLQVGNVTEENQLVGRSSDAHPAAAGTQGEVSTAPHKARAARGPQTLEEYLLWQTAQRERLQALEAAAQTVDKKSFSSRGPRRRR